METRVSPSTGAHPTPYKLLSAEVKEWVPDQIDQYRNDGPRDEDSSLKEAMLEIKQTPYSLETQADEISDKFQMSALSVTRVLLIL